MRLVEEGDMLASSYSLFMVVRWESLYAGET